MASEKYTDVFGATNLDKNELKNLNIEWWNLR